MNDFFEKYIPAIDSATILLRDGIEKVAEERKDIDNKIKRFIESIKPDKDKHIYCMVIAMSSGETWGSNSNGDFFPQEDLFADNNDYGYKTFLDAGIFQHHKNKDKKISLGEVVLSLANPIMRRIELIERVDRDLCKQFGINGIYDRLAEGENVGVSMGTRVRGDICSICKNFARSRKEYCDHARFHMNEIMPDGRKIYVINPKPKMFDISFVDVPADKNARVTNFVKEKDGAICIGNICAMPKEKHEKIEDKLEKKASMSNQIKDTHVPYEDFKKGKKVKVSRKTSFSSIPINIEVQSGDHRIGYNRGGKWIKKMECHYGFIPKTEGNDKEEVDIYLRKAPEKTAPVFIVKQLKKHNDNFVFDEDKIMLGFPSKEEAQSTFMNHVPHKYFGGMIETSLDTFKQKYLPEIKKHAEDSSMNCNCNESCCKTAAQKTSDIIKKVPATMKVLDSNTLSKIKSSI